MKKKFLVFLATLLVLLLLVLLAMALSSKQEVSLQEEPRPTNLTTPPPHPSPLPSQELGLDKDSLVKKLPHRGEGFTIEYFPESDSFFVHITKRPYQSSEALARRWFASQGVDPDTLSINWLWGTARTIRQP